jgi:hypothetical protein
MKDLRLSGGDHEERLLLGCYAVWLLYEPTFRRNLAPLHSGWQVILRSVRRLLVTANVVPSLLILVTLMMEALRSSETRAVTRTTGCNITEDGILPVSRFISQNAWRWQLYANEGETNYDKKEPWIFVTECVCRNAIKVMDTVTMRHKLKNNKKIWYVLS